MRTGRVLVVFTMLATLVMLLPDLAQARRSRVERIYRGKVILLKKRPPRHFSNQARWLRFLRLNKTKHIWPTKKDKKKWKVEFMAFFNRTLNDVEVKIKFYDITDRRVKRFIAADTFYTPARGQTILASSVKLQRERFGVNRKILMVVQTARNKVLCSTWFWLRGKEEVYSGRVTFSDDEAKLKR